MAKMLPYVKMWYEFLEEGKIMGLKCNRCGAYEFPPVATCNHCSCTELSWVEMSGEGMLESFNLALYPDPTFAAYGPFYYGTVLLKEGPDYPGIIYGIPKVNQEDGEKLFDRLPCPVKAEIMQRDGYKAVAFRVLDWK